MPARGPRFGRKPVRLPTHRKRPYRVAAEGNAGGQWIASILGTQPSTVSRPPHRQHKEKGKDAANA
jgi:hypothetical protein